MMQAMAAHPNNHSSDNPLLQLLGIGLPIIQAPMAGVQGSALALAVNSTGALGSLPCAMLTAQMLSSELQLLRAAGRPYNLNFFCHAAPAPVLGDEREAAWRAALAPYYREHGIDAPQPPSGAGRAPFSAEWADLIEPFAPPVVSFHFGLPEPALLARVKAWGARVLSSATSVAEGLWLQERGVDAVIAQGLEAGGHQGHFLRPDLDVAQQLGSFALLPQLVAALRVPVIAAGGIASAHGVAAARALGASAVHRAALKSPGAAQTALTNLFTGRPARSIVNRLMRELGPINTLVPVFPTATAAIAPLRAAAEALGRSDCSPLWAGQNTSGCSEVPAAEITLQLAAGWQHGDPR
jgi:nitronate monooxygenase